MVPSSNYLMSGCSNVVEPSFRYRMLVGTARGQVVRVSSHPVSGRNNSEVVSSSNNYPSGSYQVNLEKHGSVALREVRPPVMVPVLNKNKVVPSSNCPSVSYQLNPETHCIMALCEARPPVMIASLSKNKVVPNSNYPSANFHVNTVAEVLRQAAVVSGSRSCKPASINIVSVVVRPLHVRWKTFMIVTRSCNASRTQWRRAV